LYQSSFTVINGTIENFIIYEKNKFCYKAALKRQSDTILLKPIVKLLQPYALKTLVLAAK